MRYCCSPMNRPSTWKAGSVRMRSRTSASLTRRTEALRLGERGVLVDQLLEDLPVDAERPQHLFADLAARLKPVGLQLPEVHLPELLQRDLVRAHPGEHVGGQAVVPHGAHADAGDQGDEGDHDEAEAPLEPGLVAPHPIEHRHDEPGLSLRERALTGATGALRRRLRAQSDSGAFYRVKSCSRKPLRHIRRTGRPAAFLHSPGSL